MVILFVVISPPLKRGHFSFGQRGHYGFGLTWLEPGNGHAESRNDPTAIRVHNPLWSRRFAALAAIAAKMAVSSLKRNTIDTSGHFGIGESIRVHFPETCALLPARIGNFALSSS
jgi:hypothetical protein